MISGRKTMAALMVAGVAVSMAGTDASAATARHIYNKGHYGSAYGHHGYRHYGNARVGRAVAGAALGLIGAAAGAAVANSYYDRDYPYGGPAYSYGGYPPAPYAYGGYGYGYEPY